MSYIIDGHNLIGELPDIHLHQPDDEMRLLDRLRSFQARAGGRSMIVFFDSGPVTAQRVGSAPPALRPRLPSTPGIEVRFARPGQSADDAIADFLRTSKQPGQYAVVTNDRALAARSRSAGASVLSASQFAAQVTRRTSRPRKAPSPDTSPAPNPYDPAFADLAARFLASEKASARSGPAKRADLDAWIERLYEGDAQLAERAAQWLGESGGAQAVEPLADALTHESANVRAAALLSLGKVGHRSILEPVCDRLLNDGNSMVREAAAQCLGLIGNRSVEAALHTAIRDDSKSKVRKAARAALDAIRARGKPPAGR